MEINKNMYERYLNDLKPDPESKQWFMNGMHRKSKNFGCTLRLHDPERFEAGYQEYKKLKSGKQGA